MRTIIVAFLIFLAASPLLRAQVGDALIGTAEPSPTDMITDEAMFRGVIQELSADEFGGRKPLSRHEKPVLDYIAAKFKEVGLDPACADNTYFQKVPMMSVQTFLKNNRIDVKGAKGKVSLRWWDDAVIWSLRGEKAPTVKNADFVFVGFGINAPEYGWNDYADLDVKGKIVVVLVNDPGFYNDKLFRGKNMTYYGRWTYKFEEAGRQGAAAAIIIHDTAPASYGWSVVQNSRASSSLSLYSESGNKELPTFEGWVTGEAARKLFEAAGVSLDESIAAAKQKGFKSFPLKLKANIEGKSDVRIEESANVVGILPGTTLKDEYIIYSAHWDHLGVGFPIDGDSIYNGADDNASGVAALILLARRFKELPERPKRSIVFLAVTGEESGLLGSAYYASHPLYPVNKTVINLNMDGYGDKMRTSDVVISAAGHSDTDKYVKEAAAAQGRRIVFSNNNSSGGYYRSDHYNFAKVGIPVVLAKGGRNYLDPQAADAHRKKYYAKSTYHQPSDEYHDWWDVSGSLDDIYLFYGIGLRLANESNFPQWSDGNEFKAIRDASMKP